MKYHEYTYMQLGRMGNRTPQPRIQSWHLIHKAIAAMNVCIFARPSYLSLNGP